MNGKRIALLGAILEAYKARYNDLADAISEEMGAPTKLAIHAQAATGAGHLAQALEVLQDHKPDLVILDIEMPRMDGYEFAGHVRNNPDTVSLPIIMVTSRTGEKHRARAIELGVNDYLGKPYQEPEMLEAIRHILGDDFNVGETQREHDVVS